MRQKKKNSSQELGSDYSWDKTEDHTCPTVQLVPCSDVNAVDRAGWADLTSNWSSLQLNCVLTPTSPTRMKKVLFIHFKLVLGQKVTRQWQVGSKGQFFMNSHRQTCLLLGSFSTLEPIREIFFLEQRTFPQTLVHLVKCESWFQTWYGPYKQSLVSSKQWHGVTPSELS